MVKLEWDPDFVPPVKLGLHSLQVILSFVAWCLEIAVFMGDKAKITGQNGWTFGVCFLSIPAWVFLIMTPRFTRTRRFAQPHAMLAVDGLFIILWLSAFATQAAYNTKGDCGKVCNLSKGIVGLGVIITLLFGATTFVSAYTLTYYNFHGSLPGYDSRKIRAGGENIDPDKAAFSTAPHDEDAYERVHMHDNETEAGADRYGHANPYSHHDDVDDDPDRYGALPPRNNNGASALGTNASIFDQETEYGSGVGNAGSSMGYGGAAGRYGDPVARFPSGDYDRIQR